MGGLIPTQNDPMEFMRTTTPESAEKKLNEMLASGKVSMQQLDQYTRQAVSIARKMGLIR